MESTEVGKHLMQIIHETGAAKFQHSFLAGPQAGEGFGGIGGGADFLLLLGVHGATEQRFFRMPETLHIDTHGTVAQRHRDGVLAVADAEIDTIDAIA